MRLSPPWAEGHRPLGSPMKSLGSTIRGEQVCTIPVNLHDVATCHTPDQAGRSNVFVCIWVTAAEQIVSGPAKSGCALCPRAGDEPPKVVQEHAPTIGKVSITGTLSAKTRVRA
jgi:hypothetical protein